MHKNHEASAYASAKWKHVDFWTLTSNPELSQSPRKLMTASKIPAYQYHDIEFIGLCRRKRARPLCFNSFSVGIWLNANSQSTWNSAIYTIQNRFNTNVAKWPMELRAQRAAMDVSLLSYNIQTLIYIITGFQLSALSFFLILIFCCHLKFL